MILKIAFPFKFKRNVLKFTCPTSKLLLTLQGEMMLDPRDTSGGKNRQDSESLLFKLTEFRCFLAKKNNEGLFEISFSSLKSLS